MKRSILALVLLSMLVSVFAIGCTPVSEPPIQPTETTPEPTQPTETAPEPTQPTEQEEEMDYFAALFPKDGQLPRGKEYQIYAKELADGVKGRLSEITYTWKGSKVSMETLAGVYDDYTNFQAPEESPLQRIYDEDGLYNYLLYLPDGYDPQDTETKWPVIFFFHGIGESGSNLEDLLPYGVPKYLESGGKLDAIVIAPQCPGDSHWADTNVEVEKLQQFVPQMTQTYHIDTDRMYLTGLSMGGRCTWKLALAMPDTFAAIVVVCGRTNSYEFDTIRTMPIWMFHGAGDGTVSFDNINAIVPKLVANGHRYFKLTVYPQLGHDVWTTTYARPEVYDWLLAQSKTRNAEEG